MKNIYIFLAILCVPAILLTYSFSTGSPGGYTNSPIDFRNCTNCHAPGPANPVDGWITSNIPVEGYTPGNTYTITATGTHDGVVKFGFELTAESSDSKIGTFAITEPGRTKLTGANNAVTHTSGGTTPSGNTNLWSVDWTAPADGAGDITFYAAFNAANGNGANTGDIIYTSSQTYSEFHVGIADNQLKDQLSVYPNPATAYVNVDLPAKSELRILNMTGQEVMYRRNTSTSERIELSNLSNGVYFIQVSNNNNLATIRLLKK